MKNTIVEDRVKELKVKIAKYNHHYHVLNVSLVSDYEYDMLFQELISLEETFPELKTEDSPTNKVGGLDLSNLEEVKHMIPMLSMNNAFTEEDLINFFKRVQSCIFEVPEFFLEQKFDGIAISLEYVNGHLEQASTRGNGIEGEIVTKAIRCVKNIPKTLPESFPHKNITIRGEVVLTKSGLIELNERRSAGGYELYKTTRNAVSGLVRRKETTEINRTDVQFKPYDIINYEEGYFSYGNYPFSKQEPERMKFPFYLKGTRENNLELLKEIGFSMDGITRKVKTVKEILNFIKEVELLRPELDYDIDGVVIKINKLQFHSAMGHNNRVQHGFIAYKFTASYQSTVLREVEWSMGRTGVLTPVGIIDPTVINGVKITRLSLHNIDYIREKDLHIDDDIVIERAGDVIPNLVSVSPSPVRSMIFSPSRCPYCREPVIITDDVKCLVMCSDSDCQERFYINMEYIFSKGCINIKGIGPQFIRKLNTKDINVVFKECFKTQPNKQIQLYQFIMALRIPSIGSSLSFKLDRHYLSLKEFLRATRSDLVNLLGESAGVSVYTYLKDIRNKKFIKKLASYVKFQNLFPVTSEVLKGKVFVITGSFKGKTRQDVKSLIDQASGKCGTSISKRTDYLIAGDFSGSKLDDAKKLGVRVISLDDLHKLIQGTL